MQFLWEKGRAAFAPTWKRAAASRGEATKHEPIVLWYLFAVLPKPRRLKVLKTQFTSRAPN